MRENTLFYFLPWIELDWMRHSASLILSQPKPNHIRCPDNYFFSIVQTGILLYSFWIRYCIYTVNLLQHGYFSKEESMFSFLRTCWIGNDMPNEKKHDSEWLVFLLGIILYICSKNCMQLRRGKHNYFFYKKYK